MKNLKPKGRLLPLYLLILVTLSCSTKTNPENPCYSKQDPPRNTAKLSIDQGIWGDIWFWKGNFMPVERGEICRVQRTVFVYELTYREDAEQVGHTPFFSNIYTDLITTVESDTDGFFEVALEPGIYSLFILEGDNYYSNSYGPEGEIFPVTVAAGEVTGVLINITTEAVF